MITENELPLTKPENLYKEGDKLDLSSFENSIEFVRNFLRLDNSDLIACTVHMKEKKDRRFLVTDQMQFILIEPDVRRLGWGIVKFSDLMQVNNDELKSNEICFIICCSFKGRRSGK